MEVDETMITGHLDHARFSGERFGRILNLLIRFAQRISHGRSTRSLEEDVAGRVAKRHFARACGLWSPKRLSRQNRPFRPAARRGQLRVSPLRKQASLWVRPSSRFAPLFSKKGLYYGGAPGLESGEIDFILILVPTSFLFHARFRFERRNPRLERRCLDPFVTGVPP